MLTKDERERLASCLWKLRSRVFQDLGIPEWQLNFPLNPNECRSSEEGRPESATWLEA